MKYAERFYLRDISFRDEYIRRHHEIWPQMRDLILEAGIHDYSIWLSGTDIFACYEVDDMDRCAAVLKASSIKAEWDKYMSDIICFADGVAPESLRLAFLLL